MSKWIFNLLTPVLLVSSVLANPVKTLNAETSQPSNLPPFRPPSVPLVTYNPFLSIWSQADKLTDANTQHWTTKDHPLVSLIRIDGSPYRLMGSEPADMRAFPQKSVEVTATRSIYEFEGNGVHVTMTFMQPALPDDLDVYSWPLSYITWNVRSTDGAKHKVELYDSTSAQLVVNKPNEKVEWAKAQAGPLTTLRVGTVAQPVLGSFGDDHRINWGYAYAATTTADSTSEIGLNSTLEQNFAKTGALTGGSPDPSTSAASLEPAMAFAFDLGSVGSDVVERQVIVAYDEIYAIKYFDRKLRPYWARNGISIGDLLQKASSQYPSLLARCEAFDKELSADLTKAGGEKYARIATLAYRECAAGNGLAADANGQPLFFTKENSSNGCLATVDVFFPMDPIWLLLSPSLAKASLVHVLMYCATDRWKHPYAPHELGVYPMAKGDGGGETMSVEESGNMLILCDAISQIDGNTDFVKPWWPQLTQWAKYLEQFGLDPEDQLCTDDFMGHLAHNANLSVKAILGLAAYGDMCRISGDTTNAKKYADLAKTYAEHWMKVADDGDHYRLAFDKPGTWSQKYNLVWDRILGLNVFPASVAQKEVAFYKRKLNQYGVPLDSRTPKSKSDWSIWSATMAENQADFEAIVNPFYDYLNETSDRMPATDFYNTQNKKDWGQKFYARPVVGGFFIKMLTQPDLWKKWASRDKLNPSGWAPIPGVEQYSELIPQGQMWSYTTEQPPKDWMTPGFDASKWKEGTAGFGTAAPDFKKNTDWNTSDIWMRREVTIPDAKAVDLRLAVFHDDDVQVYIDGVLAFEETGFITQVKPFEIKPDALALLKPGAKVTMAVHCHQIKGGQGIDVGLGQLVYGPTAAH